MVYFSFLSTSGCLTSDNKQCIFPWTYSVDGSNHQGCANPDNDASGLWCPTLVDDTGTYQSDGSGNWGYCSDNCFTESGKNYRFITKNPCLWGIFSPGLDRDQIHYSDDFFYCFVCSNNNCSNNFNNNNNC